MSEISLEWFFQIPGLFITIGVLLILVALLVLIIGSSRARSKKEVDGSKEESTPITEPVANPSETVSVVATPNDNVLGVNNSVSSDTSSQLSNANNNINPSVEPVVINNNENIMPVGEASQNIVTPVNITESLEQPTLESVEVPEVIPAISEPVIKKIENMENDTLNEVKVEPIVTSLENSPILSTDTLVEPSAVDSLLSDNINIKPVDSTMAPIFSEPESTNNEQNLQNVVQFTPIEPILKSSDVVLENNNSVIEPILEPKIESIKVPTNMNSNDGNITVNDNQTVINKPVENTDIEEIL